MTSALSTTRQEWLGSLGFVAVRTKPRPVGDDFVHDEVWLSQEDLPHIEILLDPTLPYHRSDIVRLIFHAGASAQRDTTRAALNHLINTVRNGQHVEPFEDLLALEEHTQQVSPPSALRP